jgi:mono/diheme cytochrome c family protein
MKDIFQWIFAPLALVVLLLFIVQVWKVYHPPYLSYQKQFKAMLVQKAGPDAKALKFKYGVRQRWIAALNRADRCETCHLGSGDPRFKDAPEPFKTHPDFMRHDFEKFGCTVCHAGQGRAVTLAEAHGPVANWNKAIYHPDFMENSCAQCHGVLSRDQMPVYASGRSLFNELGCLGCHEVKGLGRTPVGPPLDDIGAWVKTDWLFRWIRSPRSYLPQARMPDYMFSDAQAAEIARFLMNNARPQHIVLNGSYDNGKKIFNESRCVSCHAVSGKGGTIGPDLGKIATKLEPARLLQIIINPHKFWPEITMPIYGFSDSEAMDVATFMEQEYIDFDLTDQQITSQKALVGKADAGAGQKLVQEYGCIGCHAKIRAIKDEGPIGPELTAIDVAHISHFDFGEIRVAPEDRTVPNWIYNKMLNPRLYKADLKMPSFYFKTDKAVAITTYLLSLKGDAQLPDSYRHPFEQAPPKYSPQGEFGRIIEKYRCLVCHKIYGNGGTMAPELTWEGSRVRKDWLISYMKTPYAIRPLLVERMPRFKISDAECDAIYDYFHTTLLDSRVEDLAAETAAWPLNRPEIIQAGKNLYAEHGCDACHAIDLKGGSIAPVLTNARNRLRTEYVDFYLRDPKAFVTRSVEPVYHFSQSEIEALTAFIVAPKEEK